METISDKIEIRRLAEKDVWPIRQKVMWPEENIDFIKLKDDETALHFGLVRSGEILSVVSLFLVGHSIQFRKLATLVSEQGKGYGSRLLTYALEQCNVENTQSVWCNARVQKIKFYERFGLIDTGKKFMRKNQQYTIMKKTFLVS